MKPAALLLAGVAIGHATARGDWFPLLGTLSAAIFGGLVVLIVLATDVAVRVAGRAR